VCNPQEISMKSKYSKMSDAEFALYEANLAKEYHAEEAEKLAVAMVAVDEVSKANKWNPSWGGHWSFKPVPK
jgi:hypothetical protein